MRKKSEILSIIKKIQESNELLLKEKFDAIEDGNWKKVEKLSNEIYANSKIIHTLKWVMLEYNEVIFN